MSKDLPDDAAIVMTRTIAASCDALWLAWTTPETMRRWLAPGQNVVVAIEADVRVGGAFRIESVDPSGGRHVITGRYRLLEPGRHIAKTWIYEGPIAEIRGLVTLLEADFRAIDGTTTELTLRHRRVEDRIARDIFAEGWPSCLDKLRDCLRGLN
jgi:uncharacterized protein YndB with AHSA1/START domain